MTYIEIALIII